MTQSTTRLEILILKALSFDILKSIKCGKVVVVKMTELIYYTESQLKGLSSNEKKKWKKTYTCYKELKIKVGDEC